MMRKTIALLLITLSIFVFGCTAPAAPEVPEMPSTFELKPNPTPEPTATPTPEPTPVSEQTLELAEKAFLDGFSEQFKPDLRAYIFDATEDQIYDYTNYLSDEEQIATATLATELVNSEVTSALESATVYAEEILEKPVTLTADIEPLTWKYLSAYLFTAALETNGNSFANGAVFEIDLDEDGNLNVSGKFDYGTFTTAYLAELGQEANDGFGTYSYLMTVFDDEGEVKEYELPPLPETLVYPVPGRIDLRDGWYNARDGGKRFHTGMDIRAPEGTDIVSCSAGTVEKILYNDKAGNYVQIIDDYGNRFFYCHMVKLTDFLQPGDRVEPGEHIGDVGNTGNSAANHLHLTIYDANGFLVNPYIYIVEAAENE